MNINNLHLKQKRVSKRKRSMGYKEMETKTTTELGNELIAIVDNAEVNKEYSLPKYSEYGYTSLEIYSSDNWYFLLLKQPSTSDFLRSFKRIGDAKKYAKKLITANL